MDYDFVVKVKYENYENSDVRCIFGDSFDLGKDI